MMLSELLLFIGICLIAYAFYKWGTLNNDYFAKRNVPFKKPTFLLGGSKAFFFDKKTGPEFLLEMYNSFPTEKMYGSFDLRRPFVIVRDPELLKQLAVKDFEHFEDHRAFVDPESDDLFGSSLFLMKGQRWRDMRATLSPAFTGSKMRQMFELVTECADEMTKHFLKLAADGENLDFEMKDLFSRYTNDVIASCAFGIRINSIENPNNEFFVAGRTFTNFGAASAIFRYVFMRALPWLARKMNVQFISTAVNKFFSTMVLETMDERKKRGIFRPDMINMLMQVRQGKLTEEPIGGQLENAQSESAGFATVEESDIGKKASLRQWTDKEIVAQAFIFFLAGFETTATSLSFVTYELCVNPDIQQKLYEEIVETNDNLDGKQIDYDTLQKMKYLDQVVSETLRKWPAAPQIDRVCVKQYLCEYDDGAKHFLFEEDVGFLVPIYAFHHDPKYFPNPEKFDPERFSEENKQNIKPGTYLPFGIGPRNCIGSRFALMEIKAIIYYILLHFSLVPNAKSQIPIQLEKTPFSMQTERGLFMTLCPRKKL